MEQDKLDDLLNETSLPAVDVPKDSPEALSKITGDLSLLTDLSLPEQYEKAMNDSIDFFAKKEKFSRERFAEQQLPIVRQILKAFCSGTEHVVVEAPTGTGKSIIGMVVSETLLRVSEGTQSYVLTSNKQLQEQMEGDAKIFDLDWVLLKGQDNYICGENMQVFSKRQCSDMTISRAARELGCAETCEYLVTRAKAMIADGTVFSYAYFLTTMNFVYRYLGGYAPFQPRDLTVFDECHTVSDQVQSMFTVNINDKMPERMQAMLYFVKHDEQDLEIINSFEQLIEKSTATIKILFDNFDKLSNFQFLMCVKRMADLGFAFYEMLQAHESKHIPEKSKDIMHKRLQKMIERYANLVYGLKLYVETNTGKEDMIIKHIEEQWVKIDEDDKGHAVRTIVLRTLDEASLMQNHVHKFTNRSLWMSATIGDIPTFARLNGIGTQGQSYAYVSIDSNFEFKDCPIYKVRPAISLAAKDKHTTIPSLIHRISLIMDHLHPNERGIIHTGNYEIANRIKNELFDPRLIFYANSREKEHALTLHRERSNGVIVGPSLIEGISLDDDLARFQINAKVPYPNIGDALNKAKLDRIQGWYDYKTIQSIIQSFGRPIRHKKDWAVIYLMDSCFDLVFRKAFVPPYIRDRFKLFDITEVQSKANRKSDDGMIDDEFRSMFS